MLYGARTGGPWARRSQTVAKFCPAALLPRHDPACVHRGARLRQRTSTEGSLEMEAIEMSKNPAFQPGIGHALK